MTTTSIRPTPAALKAAAWAAHEAREEAARIQPLHADYLVVLQARRAVAQELPGCATAILSDDPNLNWDRGRLVQDEIAKISGS